MVLPHLWALWGLGWLCMPRMTIGLLILLVFDQYRTLGLVLAIIGAIIDTGSGVSTVN